MNGQAYTRDDNGNLVSDGAKTYTYNQANRLTELTDGTTTYQFNYNGDGARLKQMVNGVVTTYTQDLEAPLPVVLQSKTGANATKYVYALGTRPLVQYGTAWEYLLADALGSVRQIVQPMALPDRLSICYNFAMPTICIFDGIKIMMFYRDHFPAHFHAEYGGEEAEIGVDPIMILEGSLSRPIRAKVFEWAAIHQAELRAN